MRLLAACAGIRYSRTSAPSCIEYRCGGTPSTISTPLCRSQAQCCCHHCERPCSARPNVTQSQMPTIHRACTKGACSSHTNQPAWQQAPVVDPRMTNAIHEQQLLSMPGMSHSTAHALPLLCDSNHLNAHRVQAVYSIAAQCSSPQALQQCTHRHRHWQHCTGKAVQGVQPCKLRR